MAPMGYHAGARGKLIHGKNLKTKISCQTPFKIQIIGFYQLKLEHFRTYFRNKIKKNLLLSHFFISLFLKKERKICYTSFQTVF
jgi:hypothetical protein